MCIPAFNAGKYLEQTLNSVLMQTVEPYEIIVCDDHSTDNTIELVEKTKSTSQLPIRLLQNENNMGIGFTRQRLLDACFGDYVAFLSSDDVWDPKFLEKSLEYVNPQTATYCIYWFCTEHLEPRKRFNPPEYTSESVVKWALQKNMYINFSGIVFPRLINAKFNPELKHGEDLIWLLDTISQGLTWRKVPFDLLSYRVHPNQGTKLKTYRQGKEFMLLWSCLTDRLTKLRVPASEVAEAKAKSWHNANPPLIRVLASRIYHKIKGV